MSEPLPQDIFYEESDAEARQRKILIARTRHGQEVDAFLKENKLHKLYFDLMVSEQAKAIDIILKYKNGDNIEETFSKAREALFKASAFVEFLDGLVESGIHASNQIIKMNKAREQIINSDRTGDINVNP